jgi:chromate transporter
MSSLRRKKVARDEQHRRPPGSPEGQRTPDTGVTPARDLIPFREALRTWFAISLQTFGGPAGQIAVMQRVLVEEKRWIGQRRFLHALSYCTLLPGPEAQQLAIYIGWLLNGTRGGLAAGTLFVLPGVVALFALSAAYVAFGATTVVTALFAGLGPAVLAIVTQAVLRVGKRALAHPALVAVAVAAFLALAVFRIPFPVVIAAAAATGWALGRFVPHVMSAGNGHSNGPEEEAPVLSDDALHAERPTGRRAVRILAIGLALWAAPLVVVLLMTGTQSGSSELSVGG